MRHAWLALSLIACDAPPAGRTCADRVASFRTELDAVSPGASPIGPPAGIELATAASGEARRPRGPMLALARDGGMRVDGRDAPDLARVHDDLEVIVRNWGMLHPGSRAPDEIAVWADRRAHVREVRAMIAQQPTRPWVLIVRDGTPALAPPPCPPSLGTACARIADPETRVDAVSGALRQTHGRCAPMITFFGSLASIDTFARFERIRTDAPHALEACGCGEGVDVEGYTYLVRVMLGALEDRYRVVPLSSLTEADDALEVGDWLAR